jgi:hypothetical protein
MLFGGVCSFQLFLNQHQSDRTDRSMAGHGLRQPTASEPAGTCVRQEPVRCIAVYCILLVWQRSRFNYKTLYQFYHAH